MKVQNVMNCSFCNWYSNFKKVTVRSRIIPLKKEFIDYLLADGIVLPESSWSKNFQPEEENEDEVDWNSYEDQHEASAPNFPELENQIRDAISDLGGSVLPKLNWSSPKDASWISMDNTTKCITVSDIFLLLKSSDFVMHDLTLPFKCCEDAANVENIKHELILRKWVDIDPATEFRCFVYDNNLIGICQRDCTTFYKFMNDERDEISKQIKSFYREKIAGKFPDSDYVFDVYIKNKECIRLVDFNPYGPITDSLLFDWSELDVIARDITDNKQDPVFRCVTCDAGVQPNQYRHYSLPRDIVDLTTGEDPMKLVDLLQMKIQSAESSDDETSTAS